MAVPSLPLILPNPQIQAACYSIALKYHKRTSEYHCCALSSSCLHARRQKLTIYRGKTFDIHCYGIDSLWMTSADNTSICKYVLLFHCHILRSNKKRTKKRKVAVQRIIFRDQSSSITLHSIRIPFHHHLTNSHQPLNALLAHQNIPPDHLNTQQVPDPATINWAHL